MKYVKETPRLSVKFINGDTDEILFEINNKNCTNIGEIFSDSITTAIIQEELKNKPLPKNVMVIAIGTYKLI